LLSIISKAETQYLDEAKIDALRPPKQDRATAMGMVQLNMPNVWSANVWGQKRKGIQSRTGFIILLHPRSLNKCSHY
jgi:hypothetical protein